MCIDKVKIVPIFVITATQVLDYSYDPRQMLLLQVWNPRYTITFSIFFSFFSSFFCRSCLNPKSEIVIHEKKKMIFVLLFITKDRIIAFTY